MILSCLARYISAALLCSIAISISGCAASSSRAKTSLGPDVVDVDAPQEFTTTGSGLKYRILRKSDKRKPTADDTVTVHYRGWLDPRNEGEQGEVFDTSYTRGEPTSFPLRGVIPGWTEGIQYVGEGGLIELEIPYKLGYDLQGMPPKIPPVATLHFLVELIDIE